MTEFFILLASFFIEDVLVQSKTLGAKVDKPSNAPCLPKILHSMYDYMTDDMTEPPGPGPPSTFIKPFRIQSAGNAVEQDELYLRHRAAQEEHEVSM